MVILVALPVAGVTLAGIVARTTIPTAAEERSWNQGQADDVVASSTDDTQTFADAVRAAYPSQSHIVSFSEGRDAVFDADRHLHYIETTDQPLDEPLLRGTLKLVGGRAPRTAGEVAVSPRCCDSPTRTGAEASCSSSITK